MPSILITAPAAEPIALAEAKAFLRVEHTDDDALISSLIAGARGHIEAATRRALMTQTWRLVLDAWPVDGVIAVSPAPLQSVSASRIYRANGTTLAIAPSSFVVDAASAHLVFSPGALPAPERARAGIEIDVQAGYGNTGADVPEPLRQAMRLLIAHWYENRALVGANGGAPLPATVQALIAPYKVLAL